MRRERASSETARPQCRDPYPKPRQMASGHVIKHSLQFYKSSFRSQNIGPGFEDVSARMGYSGLQQLSVVAVASPSASWPPKPPTNSSSHSVPSPGVWGKTIMRSR